jgi:hypothetical protein
MLYVMVSVCYTTSNMFFMLLHTEKNVCGMAVQTLSSVENCIPCLLHCKKHVIDKVIRVLLLKAQENQQNNPRLQLYVVFRNLKTLSITMPWGELSIQEGTRSQLIKNREPYWISKWMETPMRDYWLYFMIHLLI